MSYDHIYFRPTSDSIKTDDFDEDILTPIGTNQLLREKLSNMFDIEWHGVGEDFCLGNWFGNNEGAEFRLHGGDNETNMFYISAKWDLVSRIAKEFNLWILDPQKFVMHRSDGSKVD